MRARFTIAMPGDRFYPPRPWRVFGSSAKEGCNPARDGRPWLRQARLRGGCNWARFARNPTTAWVAFP